MLLSILCPTQIYVDVDHADAILPIQVLGQIIGNGFFQQKFATGTEGPRVMKIYISVAKATLELVSVSYFKRLLSVNR